jgi:hypothetical protein
VHFALDPTEQEPEELQELAQAEETNLEQEQDNSWCIQLYPWCVA